MQRDWSDGSLHLCRYLVCGVFQKGGPWVVVFRSAAQVCGVLRKMGLSTVAAA